MALSVIILGSNPATKLALIRSVGEAFQCRITVINMVNAIPKKKKPTFDCTSKYVSRYLYALKFQPEALCETLLSNCIEEDTKPIILSVDDDSAYMIDTLLDRLTPYFICANIDNKQGGIARLMNKQLQKQLAVECGFNVAKSWEIDYIDGNYIIPEDIEYPCFIKGLLSYHSLKIFHGKCNSQDELIEKLKVISSQIANPSPLMAEEYIDIEEDLGIIGFCDGKECIIPAVVELLDGGHGSHQGVSAYGLIRRQKEGENFVELASDLVSSLHLNSLFNMDIVKSRGKYYFVELNLRFAAYGYAVTESGVNLPEYFIQNAMNNQRAPLARIVEKECIYLNEHVGLDDVHAKIKTRKEYKEIRKKADLGLVENKKDHKPYSILKQQALLNYLKSNVKRLIYR